MYQVIVLDPDCFEKRHFELNIAANPSGEAKNENSMEPIEYSRNLLNLMSNIKANCLVVIDIDESVKRAAFNNLNKSNAWRKTQLQTVLVEIYKAGGKFAKVSINWPRTNDDKVSSQNIADLANGAWADWVVAHSTSSDYATRGSEKAGILHVDSPQNGNSIDRLSGLAPLSSTSKDDFQKYIGRAVRFSPSIEVYDRYIHGKRQEKFLNGIGRILEIWNAQYCCETKEKRTLNIYTLANPKSEDIDRTKVSSDILRTSEILSRKNVEKTLRERYFPNCSNVAINYHVKWRENLKDKRHFHARYLCTKHATLMFDPGFDFLKDRANAFIETYPYGVGSVLPYPGVPDELEFWKMLEDFEPEKV